MSAATQQIAILIAQALFVSVVIIGLFRLRSRLGLLPLAAFVGSNQYLQTVLSASHYTRFGEDFLVSPGSVVVDAEGGKIIDLNSAFTELSGFAPKELIGLSLAEANLFDAKTIGCLMPALSAEWETLLRRSERDPLEVDLQLTRFAEVSIAKALIEKMNGTLDFTSREGEGTTFYFDLLRHRSPSSAQAKRRPDSLPPGEPRWPES